MGRLFGTDGVRGKAGEYPLDAPTIRRLGAALARALGHGSPGVRFLAGRDTRESGEWIERELAAGIASQGGTLTSAGVIPTPAIAYLTPRMGYTAGVVISASHNPFDDNGIKVFSGTGEKFTERLEAQVESIMADSSWRRGAPAPARPVEQIDYRSDYIAHLLGILPPDERHRAQRIVVDCANGATTTVAPRAVQAARLRRDVHRLRAGRPQHQPGLRLDGARSCWRGRSSKAATAWASPTTATATARSSSTPPVTIVDGDAVMLMCAKQMKAEGRLKGNAVVATVMSNIGLEIALREAGIDTGALRRRRQVRDGGDDEARPVARRRAVGPRHLLGVPVHRRRPGDVAQRAADDGRHRARARRSGRRS